MDIDLHIGRQLRRLRRRAGFTQLELANACGLRFQQIQKYECAANRMSAARLWVVAQVFGVPITYFFEGLPAELSPARRREKDTSDHAAAW